MSKKKYYLTKTGLDELKAELEELNKRRLEVAAKLKIAREYGDLSENAEYHNARDEQVLIDTRAKEIELYLNNAEIIKSPSGNGKVELGSTVVLTEKGKEKSFTIVGSVEANPDENKISDESPIGMALLGKTTGDKVEIGTSNGKTIYTIKLIK